MNLDLLNDANWLYKKYWEEELTHAQIAELIGCSRFTVGKYMRKCGIHSRSYSEAHKLSYDNNPERRQALSAALSQRNKENWKDPVYRDNMTVILQDKEFLERKANIIAVRNKENWKDPVYRDKMTAMLRESTLTRLQNLDYIEQLSQHMKSQWEDTEFRESQLARLSGDAHPTWRGGISRLPYTEDFNEEFKEYIRELQDYKCFVCDVVTRETNKLDVHHIDYNKKNSTVENCVALCKSCHSKTNFNRDVWQTWFETELAKMEIVTV